MCEIDNIVALVILKMQVGGAEQINELCEIADYILDNQPRKWVEKDAKILEDFLTFIKGKMKVDNK